MSSTRESETNLLSLARRLDPVCDEFEAAWRSETPPSLEDFLKRGSLGDRAALLRELLAIEWHHRERRGEHCDGAEYRRRFPELVESDFPADRPLNAAELAALRTSGASRTIGESTILLPKVGCAVGADRYRILTLHARGGMGEVWTAQDESLGRRVAYKRMRAGRDLFQERFLAEAQITGQLEHPGIVPVHESGRDAAGRPYYVMRFVEGRTLKVVIADAHAAMALDPSSRQRVWLQLLEIYLAICRTVAFAHHRGVIHRDIKPDNVMVGEFGETLLLDWGLAKVVGAPEPPTGDGLVRMSGGRDSTATQDGNVMGSPQYMPPEMADGRASAGDVRTDVYLLGATLYEILTKRPPRQGSSQIETVELARTTSPPQARRVNPSVSRALEAICTKAMAREKESRYSSAQELAADVERYLSGEPVGAYRESWSERLGRWVRRHRRVLLRGAAAVLAIAGIATAAALAIRAQRRANEFAQQLSDTQLVARAAADFDELSRAVGRLHYALADSSPLDDRLSCLDTAAVQHGKSQVDRIAARWRPDLSDFPLEDRRERMKRMLADATLWRIQQESVRADAGQAERLLKELDAVAPAGPSPAGFHRLRATCLLQAGKSDLAEIALTLARQSPLASFDHFLLGEQRRVSAREANLSVAGDASSTGAHGELRDAISDYGRCLELDPANVWAHLQKGRCHLLRGEHDEAKIESDLAVALEPELPWAWTVRGFVFLILKNRTAAERDLDYALKLEPDFEPARLNRGAVDLNWQDTKAARVHFQAVLAVHPESVPARYYLAFADFLDGRHDEALRRCESLCQESPRLTAPRLLAVQAHLARGDGTAARAELDGWLSASSFAASLGGAEAAARRCHLWRTLAPRQLGPGRRLTWELAITDGRAALDGGATTAQAYDDLAGAYLALGKSEEALRTLAGAVDAAGSETLRAQLRLKRGLALVNQGDHAAARAEYAVAARLAGSDSQCQLIRAEAHAMLGYVAARQEAFDTAQRETTLAAAQLRQANHFALWINLGCVFNAMAENVESAQEADLRDAALEMLANAMFQARRTGHAAEAARLIRGDEALKSLQSRPRFQEIVAEKSE